MSTIDSRIKNASVDMTEAFKIIVRPVTDKFTRLIEIRTL